jgi:hypothetical protein
MTQDADINQGYFVMTHRIEIYNRLSRNYPTTSDMHPKPFVQNPWSIKRRNQIIIGEVALWPTMQSLSRSCDKERSCSGWVISTMAERKCRSHYCTMSFGYVHPSIWGCTIRLRLCSDRWKHGDPGQIFAELTLTFFPNWFDVPSMQTMRFLPFDLWPHGICASSAAVLEFGSTAGGRWSVRPALGHLSSADW